MTGMPRKFRQIIGTRWEDPTLDRPILRRLPIGWKLDVEPRRNTPVWFRLAENPEQIIGWVIGVILLWAVLTAFREARAAEPPKFPKAVPVQPVWTKQRCAAAGRTYLASSSDGRKWVVRCTGRPVRT